MKENISAAFAAYEPVHYKTFQGALDAFFEQECPMIGGSRTRQTLVNVIYNMAVNCALTNSFRNSRRWARIGSVWFWRISTGMFLICAAAFTKAPNTGMGISFFGTSFLVTGANFFATGANFFFMLGRFIRSSFIRCKITENR